MEISAKVFMKDIVGWQYFLRSENINSSQKRHTGEGKIVYYNVLGESLSFKLAKKKSKKEIIVFLEMILGFKLIALLN